MSFVRTYCGNNVEVNLAKTPALMYKIVILQSPISTDPSQLQCSPRTERVLLLVAVHPVLNVMDKLPDTAKHITRTVCRGLS
ncbi:hypothetical protein LTR17_013933 [Elasticomyces elasticus]|nr:hypothetical protein LTR17_013933 [Elasticomyces elasticus]